MSHGITRRGFLKGTALAAGVTVLTGSFRTSAYAANDKVNSAHIGFGGRGASHLDPASKAGDIVALCDCDEKFVAGKAKVYPGAKTNSDYREMFDKQKDFDAVFIATPDHHHFPASLAAMQHGKHVYCEKPLTHSIWEARTLMLEARKAKVATQMGNQDQAGEGVRLLQEWVNDGAIGPVKEVHVWTDRPAGWWPQGIDRPKDTPPVPAGLKWDLWLGVAPERPYNPAYHPFKWRGWIDFGTGALGDIACHAMDPIFRACKLGDPITVEAEFEGLTSETYPNWSIITYQYPARGDLPPVKLVWYDGKKMPPPPKELEAGRKLRGDSSMFYGEKGVILYEGTPRLLPETRMAEYKKPAKTLPRSPGFYEEFFLACKGGKPAGSNFDHAGAMTAAIMTGNLAIRLKKKIEWDGAAMKARNAPEADEMIHRKYRPGWINL
jgi:hypothetical protein